MSNQSPYVVSQLVPEGTDGRPAGVYQLTAASVSPTIIVGRDENGMPIEETVPTVHYQHFAMVDGGWNKVPLRTGSVFSMHEDAVAYERAIVTDLIRAGCIPGWLCPYSTEYTHLTRGPFVKIPDGESDCGGDTSDHQRNGGCKHLKALMVKRRQMAADKAVADQRRIEAMKTDEIARMREGIVEGVGQVLAKHLTAQEAIKASRGNLRTGKGEQE